jgi:hypothetical protein
VKPAIALAFVSFTLCAVAPKTARAGAWTTPEGKLWTKIALFHLDSSQIFVDGNRVGRDCPGGELELGQRAPYDCTLGGGLRTTTMFFEGAIGVHDRVDLHLSIPVFVDSKLLVGSLPLQRRGLGDIRFGGKVLALRDPVVLSALVEAKAPTGFFTRDAVGLPLGEGQWDLELRGLVSKSMENGKLWGGVELGYRVRFPNDTITPTKDIGDEIVTVAELGGRPVPWLYLPLRWELMWGLPDEQRGQELNDPNRIMYLRTGITVSPFAHLQGWAKTLGVEWGVAIPLWGRGWPADPVWHVAVSNSVRVFDRYSAR